MTIDGHGNLARIEGRRTTLAIDDLISGPINNPLRNEIISRILDPRGKCPEYGRCSGFGTIPQCEMGPKDRKKFAESVQKLFALGNTRHWYPLRDAIRKLNSAGALKTCEMQAAFFSVMVRIAGEEAEKKAASYDSARELGRKRVGEALKAVTNLERSIELSKERQPKVRQTEKFTEAKRALCELVNGGLGALKALFETEERVSSHDALKEIHQAIFRQNIEEILHISTGVSSFRYWQEIHDILDGVEEVLRRPRTEQWSKTTPKWNETIAGTNLRNDTNELSASDEASIKRWFSTLGPDMCARFENGGDQIALFKEVMEYQPNLPAVIKVPLEVAFLYKDQFVALHTVAECGFESTPKA